MSLLGASDDIKLVYRQHDTSLVAGSRADQSLLMIQHFQSPRMHVDSHQHLRIRAPHDIIYHAARKEKKRNACRRGLWNREPRAETPTLHHHPNIIKADQD